MYSDEEAWGAVSGDQVCFLEALSKTYHIKGKHVCVVYNILRKDDNLNKGIEIVHLKVQLSEEAEVRAVVFKPGSNLESLRML